VRAKNPLKNELKNKHFLFIMSLLLVPGPVLEYTKKLLFVDSRDLIVVLCGTRREGKQNNARPVLALCAFAMINDTDNYYSAFLKVLLSKEIHCSF
jgi:hypothetical protein